MGKAAIVWLLAGCCFVLGCSQQFILGVPSLVAADIGGSVSDVGQLMTVFGIANGLGTPLALALLARVERKRQLMGALAVMVCGMLAMAATSAYALLLGVRLFMGVAHGVFVALSYAIAAHLAPPGKQGAYMADIALGFSVAQVMAIPLAREACAFVSWHVLYALLAALALAAMLAIARVVPRVTPDPAATSSSPRQLLVPLSDKAILFAVLGTVLIQLAYNGVYTYITPFMEDGLAGRSSGYVSAVLFGAGLMSFVGAKGGGFLADRIGTRPALIAGICLAIACYAAMLLFGWCEPVLIAAVCLWIVACWTYVPLQNLIFTRRCPEHASIAVSLTTSSLQFGGALGSALGGVMIAGLPVAYLPAMGVAGAGAGLVLQLVSGRYLRQPRPQQD